MPEETYYRPDLARVHHEGYGFHADRCAPGILALLAPVLTRGGTVLELGAGSGHLTRYLLGAGHRVIATDASPAMLDLLRNELPTGDAAGRLEVQQLTMPHDPMPTADAVVSIGHPPNYLDTEADLRLAFAAAADALRPGGVLAIDVEGYDYHEAADLDRAHARVGESWALITTYTSPDPAHFVRHQAAFTREATGLWRRDDEVHANVLVDPATLPPLLAAHGVTVQVGTGFGTEVLPVGLYAVTGRKDS